MTGDERYVFVSVCKDCNRHYGPCTSHTYTGHQIGEWVTVEEATVRELLIGDDLATQLLKEETVDEEAS